MAASRSTRGIALDDIREIIERNGCGGYSTVYVDGQQRYDDDKTYKCGGGQVTFKNVGQEAAIRRAFVDVIKKVVLETMGTTCMSTKVSMRDVYKDQDCDDTYGERYPVGQTFMIEAAIRLNRPMNYCWRNIYLKVCFTKEFVSGVWTIHSSQMQLDKTGRSDKENINCIAGMVWELSKIFGIDEDEVIKEVDRMVRKIANG